MLGAGKGHRRGRHAHMDLGYDWRKVVSAVERAGSGRQKIRPVSFACKDSGNSLHRGCYLSLIIKRPVLGKGRIRQSGSRRGGW